MSRVFAISDLHVDFDNNMQQMLALSNLDYVNDTLIVAGDVTDSLSKLETLFEGLLNKFYQVTFVFGNHELWLRKTTYQDSLEKLRAVDQLCQLLGVHTDALKVDAANASVWLVPLVAWYRMPEEGVQSLFLEKTGEDWGKTGWVDKVLCRWPQSIVDGYDSVADYFLDQNRQRIERQYDAPVISFSHFLPRRELIFGPLDRAKYYGDGRRALPRFAEDPHPQFNFSRVAGCYRLDEQLRRLGARVHVYGHQHRNRNRHIDGVTYVSHCLGNPREQQKLNYSAMPKLIWENGNMLEPDDYL